MNSEKPDLDAPALVNTDRSAESGEFNLFKRESKFRLNCPLLLTEERRRGATEPQPGEMLQQHLGINGFSKRLFQRETGN